MIFRKKCRHRWEETGRKSVPGALATGMRCSFGGGFSNPDTPYILYGFTTVELRCEACGDVATRHLVGTVK